jgi:hypothetical protein
VLPRRSEGSDMKKMRIILVAIVALAGAGALYFYWTWTCCSPPPTCCALPIETPHPPQPPQ